MPWFAETIKSAYRAKRSVPIKQGDYWIDCDNADAEACISITDTGEYRPIPVENSFSCNITFYANDSGDEGKEITITYKNKGGSFITEKLKLSFAAYSVTENQVSQIISRLILLKQPTPLCLKLFLLRQTCVIANIAWMPHATDVRNLCSESRTSMSHSLRITIIFLLILLSIRLLLQCKLFQN
jgi:hypothetical protein